MRGNKLFLAPIPPSSLFQTAQKGLGLSISAVIRSQPPSLDFFVSWLGLPGGYERPIIPINRHSRHLCTSSPQMCCIWSFISKSRTSLVGHLTKLLVRLKSSNLPWTMKREMFPLCRHLPQLVGKAFLTECTYSQIRLLTSKYLTHPEIFSSQKTQLQSAR